MRSRHWMFSWCGTRTCSTLERTTKTAFASFPVFCGLGTYLVDLPDQFPLTDVTTSKRSLPLMQLAGSIDSETLLSHPPSEGRVAAFTALTGQPFDYPLNTTSDETVPVYCPACSQSNPIPWITYKGDGFAQRGFGCICNNCRFIFAREVCNKVLTTWNSL